MVLHRMDARLGRVRVVSLWEIDEDRSFCNAFLPARGLGWNMNRASQNAFDDLPEYCHVC